MSSAAACGAQKTELVGINRWGIAVLTESSASTWSPIPWGNPPKTHCSPDACSRSTGQGGKPAGWCTLIAKQKRSSSLGVAASRLRSPECFPYPMGCTAAVAGPMGMGYPHMSSISRHSPQSGTVPSRSLLSRYLLRFRCVEPCTSNWRLLSRFARGRPVTWSGHVHCFHPRGKAGES